jgi:PAS domain S-box-containing protein
VWFHALVELAPDAVLVFDPAGGIRVANRAAERLFGYPPERLVGRPLTDLMPEELRGAHLEGFGRYLETGERRVRWEAVEVTVLDSAGERVPVEVSFTEIAQGGERLFAGVVRDIRPLSANESMIFILSCLDNLIGRSFLLRILIFKPHHIICSH